jgi:hypothetical protein
MRLAIPLFPWAISVVLERRSRRPLRWQFHLKTLLTIVVIAALFMAVLVARQRQRVLVMREREWKIRQKEYRDLAAVYTESEASHLKAAETGETNRGVFGDGTGFFVLQMGRAEHSRVAAESGRMRRKYERAAVQPWLPVERTLEPDELRKIADEQGAVPTAKPPSWFRSNLPILNSGKLRATPQAVTTSTGQDQPSDR